MSKPAKKEFSIEDLFGSVPFSSTGKGSNHYPNTVPFAKDSLRSSILGDIFDNSDHKHSSATVVFSRRKSQNNSAALASVPPPPQQVFNNNNNLNNNSYTKLVSLFQHINFVLRFGSLSFPNRLLHFFLLCAYRQSYRNDLGGHQKTHFRLFPWDDKRPNIDDRPVYAVVDKGVFSISCACCISFIFARFLLKNS